MLLSKYQKLNEDDSGNALVTYVHGCIKDWQDIAQTQIEKCEKVRDYLNDIEAQKSAVQLSGDIAGSVTISTTPYARSSVNRLKTDIVDLTPNFAAEPRNTQGASEKKRVVQSILDKLVLTDRNISNISSCGFDVIDMGLCAARIDVEHSYDSDDEKITNNYKITRIYDINSVYFDSTVPFDLINSDGECCGFVGDNGKIEHFELIKDTKKYGKKYDPTTSSYYWVLVDNDNKKESFLDTVSTLETVAAVHIIIDDEQLVSCKPWKFGVLPLLIGGNAIDRFADDCDERLTIIPYAEHVIDEQKKLDFASTLQMYNLSMSRGTTKAMYTDAMVEGYEALWQNRNTSSADLKYNLIKDGAGNMLPLKPEFVSDVPLSPVVSEIVSTAPAAINAMLGTNLEQDVTYNMSGEAIKKMQMVRGKNAKIYMDLYVKFVGEIGERMQKYLAAIERDPRVITVNNYGDEQQVLINSNIECSLFIPDVLKNYEIKITVSSSDSDSKQQTMAGLNAIYQSFAGSPLQAQTQAATADILASSIDSKDVDEIAKRIKPLVPMQTLQLSNGQANLQQIQQQQAQQAQQQQMQQMQQTMQMLAIQQKEMQAKLIEAQADMQRAIADIIKAKADVATSQDSVQVSKVKANAEIAKAYKDNQSEV